MTAKEAIKAIGALIQATFGEQQTEQTFESGKLADGTVIQYTALEPGADIFVLGPDGSQQPAPAGELELEDGTIIVIAEPGKIAEVMAKAEEAPAEEQEMEEAPASVDYGPQIEALTRENADLKTRLDALEKRNGAFAQMFQAVHSFMSAVSKEDSAKPAQPPKQTVFKADKAGKDKAIEKVAAALASLK